MSTLATGLLLLVSLLLVPLFSLWFGTAPGQLEWQVLATLAWIVLGAWSLTFVVGELSGNVSQVDRLWSLLPIVYVWVVAAYGEFSPRLLLMASLVTIWGLRLTYNFSRHGAYRGRFWREYEDYRWQVLRENPSLQPAWKWTLFNFVFIAGYQNMLILLFTLPAVLALQFRTTPLGTLDLIAAVLMILLIACETIADNQQWRFQAAKKARIARGQPLEGDLVKGFVHTGVWARSRHPNYFAEQGVWIAFYLFSVAASGQWLNWTITGCLLLMLLFRGSTAFSESISVSKYPQYTEYQRGVPRFLPLGRGLGRRQR